MHLSTSSERNTSLTAALSTCARQLAPVAESWVHAGATSFSVWRGDTLLARWPSTAADEPGFVQPVTVDRAQIGELQVTGIEGPSIARRLAADADFLSRLVILEAELGAMTSEVIDIQDQVLALYDLAQSLRNQLTIEATLGALADAAARLIQAGGAFAGILAPSGQVRALVTGLYEPGAPAIATDLVPLFTRALTEGRELLINHGGVAAFALPPGSGNLLFVPITIRGTLAAGLGVLDKPDSFTASNRKLVRSLADQAAAQLENVLLYEEMLQQAKLKAEFDLAAGIQRQLLPHHAPRHPGLTVVGRALPAQQIGGDFYDYITQPGQRGIFVVGDVSGKGMPAALLMAISHRVIHNAAQFSPQMTPAKLMARASQDLYDAFTDVSMFATIFIAQYDPESRKLTYANAGHSPVVYRPANGIPRLLEADGTALGILEDTFCEDHVLDFGPGDLLLVATDGFAEARDPEGAMFGYDRLLQLADTVAEQPAAEITERFFDAVAQFSRGHDQEDDQTLVVIKGERR